MNSYTNVPDNQGSNEDDLINIRFDSNEEKSSQPESVQSNLITPDGSRPTGTTGQVNAGTNNEVSQKQQIVNTCQWLYYALPLRILSFSAVTTVFVTAIINLIVYGSHFVPSFIVIVCSFIGMVVEIGGNVKLPIVGNWRLKLYYWARFLRRMAGRACFYFILAAICYTFNYSLTTIAGIYLMCVSLLMFVVSWMTAKKYCRLFQFVVKGINFNKMANDNNNNMASVRKSSDMSQNMSLIAFDNSNTNQSNDELMAILKHQFEKYDMDNDGFIEISALNAMIQDAGKTLSKAEQSTLLSFLDESCNGSLSKIDFMQQLMFHTNKVRWL